MSLDVHHRPLREYMALLSTTIWLTAVLAVPFLLGREHEQPRRRDTVSHLLSTTIVPRQVHIHIHIHICPRDLEFERALPTMPRVRITRLSVMILRRPWIAAMQLDPSLDTGELTR